MAVPTISTCTPATGNGGGGTLVEITGTNFRVYTAPTSGQAGTLTSRVQVKFNGVAAEQVHVHSATHLSVVTPAYTGDADAEAFTAVSVVVTNLDDSGVAISGETATKASAYTYRREPIRPSDSIPDLGHPLQRVTRQLMQMLKRQVLRNAGPVTHADYSRDGIQIEEASNPSLVLEGPDVAPAAYQERVPLYDEAQGDGSALLHCQMEVHTFAYQLVGDSDSHRENAALASAVLQFFKRNPYLVMTADVPADSTLRMPLQQVGPVDISGGSAESNIRQFRTTFEVRRVPVLYLPPSLRTWPVLTIQLQSQTMTGTLVQTKTL